MCYQLQSLEGRRHLSAGVAIEAQGVLHVRGTGGDDLVTAQWQAGAVTTLTVVLNGQSHTFAARRIKTIRVELGGGEDELRFGGAVWRPMVVKLGAGDDYAFAGGRDDVVSGGGGNDTINGSGGNDTLSGGEGDDRLEGAEGDDLIRGGAGDDHLGGWTGVNRLRGEAGDDEFWTGRGQGVIDGGEGYDRVWKLGAKWSTERVEFVDAG